MNHRPRVDPRAAMGFWGRLARLKWDSRSSPTVLSFILWFVLSFSFFLSFFFFLSFSIRFQFPHTTQDSRRIFFSCMYMDIMKIIRKSFLSTNELAVSRRCRTSLHVVAQNVHEKHGAPSLFAREAVPRDVTVACRREEMKGEGGKKEGR